MLLSEKEIYLLIKCDCCGSQTLVKSKLENKLLDVYLESSNRGFEFFPNNITLCKKCIKVFQKIVERRRENVESND